MPLSAHGPLNKKRKRQSKKSAFNYWFFVRF